MTYVRKHLTKIRSLHPTSRTIHFYSTPANPQAKLRF